MASEVSKLTESLALLLVGRVGNGKSATGNSIVGNRHFLTYSGATSACHTVHKSTAVFGERIVDIVDVPGITEDVEVGESSEFASHVKTAFELCPQGFSAFVVVLKFGTRFGKYDTEAINVLKSVLGASAIKDHGICAFTHGDNFEVKNEEINISFKRWCEQQTGAVRMLFTECGFRCVLFDNKTRDEIKRDAQIKHLLSIVDVILEQTRTNYRKNNFNEVSIPQDEAAEDDKESKAEEIVCKYLHDIQSRLEETCQLYSARPEECMEKVEVLKNEAQAIRDRARRLDMAAIMLDAIDSQIECKLQDNVRQMERNIAERNFSRTRGEEANRIRLREEQAHDEETWMDFARRMVGHHGRDILFTALVIIAGLPYANMISDRLQRLG